MKPRVTKLDKLIGANIKKCRLKLNLSQSDFSAGLNITFQQLQKYEKGTNRISASKLIELCKLHKLQYTDILPK